MDSINSFCKEFNNLTNDPDKFLTKGFLSDKIKCFLKSFYDYSQNKNQTSSKALPELIVKDFDDEQIWQELELQNEDGLPKLISKAAKLMVFRNFEFPVKTDLNETNNYDSRRKKIKDKKVFKYSEAVSSEDESEKEPEDKEDVGEEETDMDNDDLAAMNLEDEEEESDLDDDNDYLSAMDLPRKVKVVPSEVDDKFFKLSEMEAFLKHQEDKGDEIGLNVDLFNSLTSESEEEDDRPMYCDFFNDGRQNDGEGSEIDNIKESFEDLGDEYEDSGGEKFDENDNESFSGEDDKKKVRFNISQNESDCNSSDDENKIRSSYEIREDKLKKKISALEEAALQEKPWPLKGEVSGSVRPLNSLLEEVVEFDMTQRPPPIITEETTNRLEDIIKQRIKDRAFDDVERKIKPVATPGEFKKKLVLDQEKSKLSLAEIYEQEYMKQRDEQTPNAATKQEGEPEEHVSIKKMMKSLFVKLDSLSNFFFIPKPVEPELKIINNLPAVETEEVTPVGVSDSKLLAPEEVGGTFKKSLLGKEERTKTDKKRERRKKKVHQAQKFKANAIRDANKPASYSDELKKVMKFKNVTKVDEKSARATKTSTDFFNKLQDEVQSQINPQESNKKRKQNMPLKNAKKLKL